MDLRLAIQELRRELERTNEAITRLEAVGHHSVVATKRKRGRKGMGSEERMAASERMKKYWASKREPQLAFGARQE
jgi:hypothetical protein